MSGRGRDYRPIVDTWILAPSKVGYYGAYPSGFLQRARDLLVPIGMPILHVCSGKVQEYPGYGVGPYDKTLDLDPLLEPDFLQDARDPFPTTDYPRHAASRGNPVEPRFCWPAILMDPPYTPEDADHYNVGRNVLPTPHELLFNAWEVLAPGGRVGLLHQVHPSVPKNARGYDNARLVAIITVIQGCNQKVRCFTVFEKEDPRGYRRT